MKKITKSALALSLSCFMLAPMAACGGVQGGGLDKNKTGMYVGNFDGGFGDDWLEAAIARFEKEYENYYNPKNGKTGVDIEISPIRAGGAALIPSANKGVEDIYFTEWVYYYDLVASGNALDITSIMTETNADGKTIESKLTEDQVAFFDTDTSEAGKKYYALPHYSTLHGFYYNEDVFNDYSLFFKGDPNNGYKAMMDEEGYFYTNLDGVLSSGPNGIHGDYDDGLPATYEQFYKLLDKMVIKGVIPFMFSGQYTAGYIFWYLEELLYANSGVEQSQAYFNYEGTVTDLITSFNLEEPVISGDEVQITAENGYKLYTTKARYDTLRLFHKILTNSDYYDQRTGSKTHSHTSAQSDFLTSYYKKDTSKPCAMLMEGGYWYNESREFGTIEYLKNFGVSEEDIHVKYMPWPKVSEEEIGSQTAVATSMNALGFIRSGVSEENKEIALKFLQFLYTDESLLEFTQVSSTLKELNYKIEDEDLQALTPLARSQYEHVYSPKSTLFCPYSRHGIYLSSPSAFHMGETFKTSKYASAYTAFKEKNATVKEIFEGSASKYSQSFWNSSYSEYFTK